MAFRFVILRKPILLQRPDFPYQDPSHPAASGIRSSTHGPLGSTPGRAAGPMVNLNLDELSGEAYLLGRRPRVKNMGTSADFAGRTVMTSTRRALPIIGLALGLIIPIKASFADPGALPPGQLSSFTALWWEWVFSIPALVLAGVNGADQ